MATGKNSDLKQKSSKGNLYNLPDTKRAKKPWTGRVGLKKDIQESSKSENRELREIARVESAVALEKKEDDVNKENEIDKERKGYKTSFKNTKLPVTNEDLEEIINKIRLSDNVIHGFNILYIRQFENAAGLQDLLLSQTSQYSVMKNLKFVQILHSNRTHLVAVSAYSCKNGEIAFCWAE